VATESGDIASSVRTLGYNDSVDTAVLEKNIDRLENHGEQHDQTVDLNKNEKYQSQEELGQSHQVSTCNSPYFCTVDNWENLYNRV
jgi:hypothetical protein